MEEAYPDRIISKAEIEELKSFILSQELDYPNFENWVEVTTKEIIDGKRYAFGLFDEKLCGDGVIRVTASKTVELKNFFLDSEHRGMGNGSILLDYIEKFCIERGCTRMQVDVDVGNINTIQFFLRHDFEFQSRGDFYARGKDSYLLVKRLPTKYIGEYDWVAITKWVIENLWDFRLEKEIKARECFLYNRFLNDAEIAATIFVNEDLGKTLEDSNLQQFRDSKEAKGILFCFAPFFSEKAEEYANEMGIVLINRDELGRLSGLDLPRSQENAAGLIVTIKPEYFNELIEKRDRVFIKGGKLPHGIRPGHVIVFYVTAPITGITGYSLIEGARSDNPNAIWAKHSRQSAFSDEEYATYTEEKPEVTAYSFERIEIIEQALDLERIRGILGTFNHQAGQRITISEWGNIKRAMGI